MDFWNILNAKERVRVGSATFRCYSTGKASSDSHPQREKQWSHDMPWLFSIQGPMGFLRMFCRKSPFRWRRWHNSMSTFQPFSITQRIWKMVQPRKINMEPKNCWCVDAFSFFQDSFVGFRGV